MVESVISIRDLSLSYDNKRVLSNIFLEIPSGKCIGVIGPNGAGKSTLFKAILGLTHNMKGQVKIFGSSIDKVRKRIAYIPQKDEIDWQFPALVEDVVLMGRYPHVPLFRRLSEEDRNIARRAMEDLGIYELKDRQIGLLSGGQQQRVFIARALCQETDILLLDEPFVGVDTVTEQRIIEIIKKKIDENKTILVVHHDLATVNEYFDQVIMINQRLIAYGDTSAVYTPTNISRTYASQLKILQDIGLAEGSRS